MNNHEQYRKMVEELNTLKIEVDERIRRMNYLKQKIQGYMSINKEQAEAFVLRFNKHKPFLADKLKEMDRLEGVLKSIPRSHIT